MCTRRSKDIVATTDESLLRMAILHVLDNGFKAARCVENLKIYTSTYDGQPAISVRDDGQGITKKDLPRIAEMFAHYRYEKGHVEPGLGVGLCLAIDIVVHRLKGQLIIETRTARNRRTLVRSFPPGKIYEPNDSGLTDGSGTLVTIVIPGDVTGPMLGENVS
jgi:K+-sensing histidine kinase KdpD